MRCNTQSTGVRSEVQVLGTFRVHLVIIYTSFIKSMPNRSQSLPLVQALYKKAAAPIIAATTPVRPSAARGTAAPVN